MLIVVKQGLKFKCNCALVMNLVEQCGINQNVDLARTPAGCPVADG